MMVMVQCGVSVCLWPIRSHHLISVDRNGRTKGGVKDTLVRF